jgi:hypothetical protein
MVTSVPIFLNTIMKLDEILAYHGSAESKPKFIMGHTGHNSHTFGSYDSQRWGAFFSDNPKFAGMYGKVAEYDLAIKRILDCDNNSNVIWHFIQSLDPFDPNERPVWQEARGSYQHNPPRYWQFFENELGERFVAYLRKLGYDSAVFEEYNEDDDGQEHKSHTIVVLDPNLISLGVST